MKKGISYILTVIIAAAFIHIHGAASPSPEAETIVGNEAVTAVDTDGKEVSGLIITSKIPETYREVEKQIRSEEGFQEIMKNLNVAETIGAADIEDLILIDLKEVWAPKGTKFPITITFRVKGVDPMTRGTILHYNNAKWEIIPTTIGQETMTGRFSSLSPVAFVVDRSSLQNGSGSIQQGGGNEGTESGQKEEMVPQTGETSRKIFHVSFLLSAFVAIIILWRRRNAVV